MINIAAQAARNLGGFVPNKVFIGGIPITCSEEQFRSYFEQFGPIGKVELHALRGFGYITYASMESADACLEKYEEHYLSKKWVEVKRSIPRELIDAYEREQRRLTSEYHASTDNDKPAARVETQSKVESAPAPAPTPAPWGAAPSVGRKAGPSHNAKDTPGPGFGNLSRIAQLKEMGFSDTVAKRALSECAWDVNAAIDRLLASGAIPGEEDSNAEPQRDEGVPHGGGVEGSSPAPATAASVASAPGHSGVPPTCDIDAKSPHVDDSTEANGCYVSAKPNVGNSPSSPVGSSCVNASVSVCSEDAGHIPAKLVPATQHFVSDAHDQRTGTITPESAEPVPPQVENADVPRAAAEAACLVVEAKEERVATVAAAAAATAEYEHVEDPVSAHVVSESDSAASPRKRIERVLRTWGGEDPSQLSVVENEFVSVWVGTDTNNGWIHAEGHEDGAQAGWLPLCVLKPLAEGQRWMRAVQQWQAMDESQCSVMTGSMVIVWVSTRTDQGWTYAESEQDGEMKPGWLPVFCLAWTEE